MDKCTVLNFSHPLTMAQGQAISRQYGEIEERNYEVIFDTAKPFMPQVERLVGQVEGKFDPKRTLVILPSFSSIAVLLMEKLEEKFGFKPKIVRIRRVSKGKFNVYEVAEII